jgi:hypothetical protein
MTLKTLRTAFAAALASLATHAFASELPRDVHIVYDALYGDFQLKVGQADQRWHVANGRYELVTQLNPVVGPKIRYVSRGEIGPNGLVPTSFAEYRNNDSQPRSSAEFDWKQKQVRYGTADSPRSAALDTGAQDVNAFTFQLAWLGDKAAGTMQVVSGKGMGRHNFAIGEAVEVTLDGKPLQARPVRSDDPRSHTEVWLAPGVGQMPVKVARDDDEKKLVLVARSVDITR